MRILPVQKKYCNCIQMIIISYAESKNIPYDHMFLTKLNLTKDFYGFLRLEDENDLNLSFKKNLSIRKELIQYDNLDDLFVHINLKLEDTPILVHIDAFACPWNEAYKKINVCHCFLIIDIIGDTLIIVDPYCSKDIIRIDKNILYKWKAIEGNLVYKLVIAALKYEPVIIEEKFYYNILVDIVKVFDIAKYKAICADFYERIREDKSYWKDENLYMNLIMNINNIASHRMLFAESLNYIIHVYPDTYYSLKVLIPLLQEISKNYTFLKNFFVKELLTQKSKIKKQRN
ncbi:MAG: hypothetical protein HPY74_06335 [Firmicutes bacterium]|nr:hypothetical protein [Bacillota bacterium]